jgi:hypothetical protein
LTYDNVLTNQFINSYNTVITNISNLYTITQNSFAQNIDITVMNSLIQNKYINVVSDMILDALTNFYIQYDSTQESNIKTQYININLSVGQNKYTAFNTFITNTFLTNYLDNITKDVTNNIFNTNDNKKYYYKKYMTLLSTNNILYSDINNQLLNTIQEAVSDVLTNMQKTYISVYNALTTDELAYGSCSSVNSCLTNISNLNKKSGYVPPPKPKNISNLPSSQASASPFSSIPSSYIQPSKVPQPPPRSNVRPGTKIQDAPSKSKGILFGIIGGSVLLIVILIYFFILR